MLYTTFHRIGALGTSTTLNRITSIEGFAFSEVKMYPHCTHIFSAVPTPYPHPQKRNEPQEAEASQDSTTIKILPHGKNLPAIIPYFSSIQVFKLYLHRDSVGCTNHTATMRILIDNGHGYSSLNSLGVWPVKRRKYLQKKLSFGKPRSKDMSPIVLSV